MPANKPKHTGPIRFTSLAMGFQAAAEPKRAHVLLLLDKGEQDVAAICAEIGRAPTTLSRHLKLLRFAGLVEAQRDGPNRVYSLTAAGREMIAVIEALGG